MMVQGNFRFFPVGQGLFYGGRVSVPDSNIGATFVYDCGTFSKQEYLNNAIERSDSFFKTKRLNALFVSHFDQDHINGIPHLLGPMDQPNYRVDFVVLPYFPQEMLLFLQLRAAIWLSDEGDYDSGERAELERLAFNPYAYFVQREDIVRIIVIGSDDVGADGEPKSPTKDEKFGILFYLDKNLEDKLVDNIAKCQTAWKENTGNARNRLRAAKGCFQWQITNVWYWKAVVPPTTPPILKAFKEVLKKAGILDEDFNLNWESFREGCRRGTDENKAIKEAYAKIRPKKEINLTSLVLAHAPLCNNPLPLDGACKVGLTTVLFGDTALNDEEIYDYLTEELRQELERARFLSVPHHGSHNNWNNDILHLPQNYADWVVSSAIRSRFRHPHPHRSVVYDFYCPPASLQHFPFLCWCNEACYVDVSIEGDTTSWKWIIGMQRFAGNHLTIRGGVIISHDKTDCVDECGP